LYNYKGPMILTANLIYDPATTSDTVLQAIDSVIEPLRAKPVDQKLLDRTLVKLRSDLYDTLGSQGGIGLVDLLASFALFDDNPARVNTLVPEFRKVTPEFMQKTAQEYLRTTNRTVVLVQPQPQPPAVTPAKNQ
jgi:zinc protease